MTILPRPKDVSHESHKELMVRSLKAFQTLIFCTSCYWNAWQKCGWISWGI